MCSLDLSRTSRYLPHSLVHQDIFSLPMSKIDRIFDRKDGIELLIQKHNLTVRRLKTADSDKIKIALGSRGYFLAQQAKRFLRKLVV